MKSTARYLLRNAGALLLAGLLLLALGEGARPIAESSQPPTAGQPVISYQGTLTDRSGSPIDTTVTMQFSLYDASSGGNRLWGPETQAVEVSSGLFHVLLGTVTAIDPTALSSDLYLDIEVNGESLLPREVLASSIVSNLVTTGNDTAFIEGDLQVGGNSWVPEYAGMDGNDFAVNGTMEQYGAGGGRFYKIGVGRDPRAGEGSLATAGEAVIGGNASLEDHELRKVRALQLKDWDDDTGGTDNKYRLLARDGAWMFYNGGVVVGNYGNGTWSDLPDGRLFVETKIAVGTTSPQAETAVEIASNAVPLTLKEKDQSGAGSLWRMPLDGKNLRFDASQNGSDFTSYNTPLTMYPNGTVGCGAITENNLQTPEERAAGGSDRFEEGDVLCWGVDRLEKCDVANDRLVQAVADKGGRPIVIGAELVKVLGPVKRGDILVASDVPGYAMVNNEPAAGSVIAQALEDFDGKRGIIKAMIRKF